MKSKRNGAVQRVQKHDHIQKEGPNWVFVVGGALLTTLSFKLGCKLKQIFEQRRSHCPRDGFAADKQSASQRHSGACPLHANMYCYQPNDDIYHSLSGMPDGTVEMKQEPASPMSKGSVTSLPLVVVPNGESNKDNTGVMWVSSPDRLELPPKPFHPSTSSGSPCASESGSDIFNKREVIQKLRQQLKRRDEMILEMQTQISDLQTSLTSQMAHSSQLQSQLDSVNRDLFDSELEIQRLRKAIAEHCLAEVESMKKPATAPKWHADTNGYVNNYAAHTNGYADGLAPPREVHCVGAENGREGDRYEMLRKEVGDLKEVIEGKDFLLQTYKEEKVELCARIKEMQLKLASSHIPDIL